MMIRIPSKKNQEGFTLVELMIVVAIIGILAVLAIYGVSKYVQNAKTGEARNALGLIAKSAVGAYEQERNDGILRGAGVATTAASHAFCTDSTLVPTAEGSVANRKYQSAITDWGGTQTAGWTCLKFSLTEPQYFQYGYVGTAAAGFRGFAAGYFSADGTVTHGFSLGGALDGNQVVVQPQINETENAQPLKTIPTIGGV